MRARKQPSPVRTRFRDSGKSMNDYKHEFLVECPACGGCARVRTRRGEPHAHRELAEHHEAWRRLACAECGHFARWSGPSPWRAQTAEQPTGCGLPLWLRTTSRGRPIWAYNEQHLNDLCSFVAAMHRGRGRGPDGGMSSRSMVASLPSWLISAKNRADVGRALARLQRKVPRTDKIADLEDTKSV